jgi:hypothetical protein
MGGGEVNGDMDATQTIASSTRTTAEDADAVDKDKVVDNALPYVDLTSFCSLETLESLDQYLQANLTFGVVRDDGDGGGDDDKVNHVESSGAAAAPFEIGMFTANGYKHGDAIHLTERDTSGWCADTFTAFTGDEDFKVCRGHRGDAQTWRLHPTNARLLPGVVNFVQSLPFFVETGKISIIYNPPNTQGVEHCDIEFPDLVSEFVWVRPPSSTKRFYVRDPNTNDHKKVFVPEGCRIAWFDDHCVHNIEPCADPFQLSIRIDGRFTPEFRELICQQGTFKESEVFPEGSLRSILSRQQDGPLFLKEVNEPPQYSSDEDSDQDEDEDEETLDKDEE